MSKLKTSSQLSEELENSFVEKANKVISIGDFDDKLFVAFYDIPLYPIAENSTAKEILEKLKEFRSSYLQAITTMHNENIQQ